MFCDPKPKRVCTEFYDAQTFRKHWILLSQLLWTLLKIGRTLRDQKKHAYILHSIIECTCTTLKKCTEDRIHGFKIARVDAMNYCQQLLMIHFLLCGDPHFLVNKIFEFFSLRRTRIRTKMIATRFQRYRRSGMTPLGWSPNDFGNGLKLKKLGWNYDYTFFGQSLYSTAYIFLPWFLEFERESAFGIL